MTTLRKKRKEGASKEGKVKKGGRCWKEKRKEVVLQLYIKKEIRT